MSRPRQGWTVWHASLLLALATATLLPLLLLVLLGILWLWERDLFLWWLLGAVLLALVTWAAMRGLAARWRRSAPESAATAAGIPPASSPDPEWAPRDREAWEKVQGLAAQVEPGMLSSRTALLDAGRATLELVASHYHPDVRDPLWRFTVPELLLLTERVSARLRRSLLDTVPGIHLLRAGQLLRLWELRPAAERGLRAMRGLAMAWRVIRLVNPAAAALAEARDRLFSATMSQANEEIRLRAGRIWIEEIGRVAIEIYSGRFRLDAADLAELSAEHAPRVQLRPGDVPGPLRILMIGRHGVGKSTLVQRLAGRDAATADVSAMPAGFFAWRLEWPDFPEAELLDSPGLARRTLAGVLDEATRADCIVWVLAADGPDRRIDRQALDRLRDWFAERPQLLMPPVLPVLSRVDCLLTASASSPDDDALAAGASEAGLIRAAITAAAAATELPAEHIVPVSLHTSRQTQDLAAVRAALVRRIQEASGTRALRLLHTAAQPRWTRLLRQAAGAGRLLTRRRSKS